MRHVLPQLYFPIHQNKWRIDSKYHLLWKKKTKTNRPKSLIINLHHLHHRWGKNIAQSITHCTFSFFHWNICTYRKPGLLHSTDSCVLYCLSKEITPDLRLHYFKPQFLGAFLWKCLDKASQTFSGSSVLVNGAKSQSIWMHKKKIPLTVILQTTSKGGRKKLQTQNTTEECKPKKTSQLQLQ